MSQSFRDWMIHTCADAPEQVQRGGLQVDASTVYPTARKRRCLEMQEVTGKRRTGPPALRSRLHFEFDINISDKTYWDLGGPAARKLS